MSSLNRSTSMSHSLAHQYGAQNHHGLRVPAVSAESKLLRMTMAHLLWENSFYVDGEKAGETLAKLAETVDPAFVAGVAKKARSEFKLRHVPLLLTRALAKRGALKAADLADVIQRPDEMGEFLSLYWKDKKQPLSNQVKKGLAQAFMKFNEYQLAKWDKNSASVSVRDVMFLTHVKPTTVEQEALFKRVADKQLATPDTWETELSAGADKRETFTRLLNEGKLGALAFLRNLRNMSEAGVSESLIRSYGSTVNVDKVLPFRYVAAARIVPQYKDMLEQMMFRSLEKHEKFPGKTVLLIDVSGSMFGAQVSGKSDLDRFDAAAALAVMCREICESVEIYSFSGNAVRVRDARGFALIDAIRNSQEHGGTYLGASLSQVNKYSNGYDRVIVFTDEQSSDRPVKLPGSKGYVLNVAAYENGLAVNDWTTITGFSEACLDYLMMAEKTGA